MPFRVYLNRHPSLEVPSLPNIEFKSIDRLNPDDRLLVDAWRYHRAGRLVDGKLLQLLGRHGVPYVPTITLTYEERSRLPDEEQCRAYIDECLQRRRGLLEDVREDLYQALQPVYQPFSMDDPKLEAMAAQPRYRTLPKTALLANSLFHQARLAQLKKLFLEALDQLKPFHPNHPEIKSQKIFPRWRPVSIRLQPIVVNQRIEHVGDALLWHAVDTSLLFLMAAEHLNRVRQLKGCPLSTLRYDVNFSVGEGVEVHYPEEYLALAAVGAALHAVGFCERSIYLQLAGRPLMGAKTPQHVHQAIHQAIDLSRTLARQATHLSPLSRMVILGQAEYPNGSGWPALKSEEGRVVHDLVRLFHVVRFFDFWTQPWLSRLCFSREDIIAYLWNHSCYFEGNPIPFPTAQPFDRAMVEELLAFLAPWELGEKVYLFEPGDYTLPLYVGRVYQYLRSYVPLISVLKDERSGKTYPFGRFLLDIPSCRGYFMEKRQIQSRLEYAWIGQLRIHDTLIGAADIAAFQDPLLSHSRIPERKEPPLPWEEERGPEVLF